MASNLLAGSRGAQLNFSRVDVLVLGGCLRVVTVGMRVPLWLPTYQHDPGRGRLDPSGLT